MKARWSDLAPCLTALRRALAGCAALPGGLCLPAGHAHVVGAWLGYEAPRSKQQVDEGSRWGLDCRQAMSTWDASRGVSSVSRSITCSRNLIEPGGPRRHRVVARPAPDCEP